jgi:hypothetical protein
MMTMVTNSTVTMNENGNGRSVFFRYLLRGNETAQYFQSGQAVYGPRSEQSNCQIWSRRVKHFVQWQVIHIKSDKVEVQSSTSQYEVNKIANWKDTIFLCFKLHFADKLVICMT